MDVLQLTRLCEVVVEPGCAQRSSLGYEASPVVREVEAVIASADVKVSVIPADDQWWSYRRTWKSCIDRVGGLVLLVLLLPAMLVIAGAILLTMGRPVLFRQARVGRHGRPFVIFKFRSMAPDRRINPPGTLREGPERRLDHKSPFDPRISRLGRFLRKTSLDELPQLLNVVRGEMSLVGPRPELAEIVSRYEPWQHSRHLVRPGITGLWQVQARSTENRMHLFTALDIEYIERVSFITDGKILLRTLTVPLRTKSGH